MQVVTGGFAQGKLDYVLKNIKTGSRVIIIDEKNCGLERDDFQLLNGGNILGRFDRITGQCQAEPDLNPGIQSDEMVRENPVKYCETDGYSVIVDHLNHIIKEADNAESVFSFIENLNGICSENHWNLYVIGDELGCGIIPIDKKDREYRETCGRIMCRLAAEAESVIRIVCGIAQKIK